MLTGTNSDGGGNQICFTGILYDNSPPAEAKLKVFHILVKRQVSRFILDEPSVNVKGLWVGVVRGITMDSPVIAEYRSASGDEKSFLWIGRLGCNTWHIVSQHTQ